jgi:hypothetical protein
MEALYPPRSRTDPIRWLAIGSIAGQLTWVVIVVVAGLLEPGYSEVRKSLRPLRPLGRRPAGGFRS